MKALTLTQPWATLVAIGAKRIETRSWVTTYRGPLAIHAAKGFPKEAKILCLHRTFTEALYKVGIKNISELPLGCIVATCDLVDCVQIKSRRPSYGMKTIEIGERMHEHHLIEYDIPPDEPELSFGDYTPGRYAWILENVQALPGPIPCKGALGLWEWK